ILTSIFPPEERGKVIGFNVGSIYLGLSLGPFIGGLLTEHWGWRSIFGLDAFLGLLILGAVLMGLKGEWVGARGERFDFPGSVLYCVTLVSLMYGVSQLPAVSGVGFMILGMLVSPSSSGNGR
ncbi:MAG: MFS transporter, partial [Deltaproteobacteria bacterium]|nr:MFS transporter [Deltaproteobacteria bacterium]